MSLVVEQALGLVTVQDLGRPGHMHEGLAPGGALASGVLAMVNKACGNARDAAAIEVLGKLVVRAEHDVAVVITTADTRPRIGGVTGGAPAAAGSNRACSTISTSRLDLVAGDELVIESEPFRVAYLAIAGGVEAPLALGGRGTQLSAGIGSLLRAGDRITARLAGAPTHEIASFTTAGWSLPHEALVYVVPGPDHDAFTTDALSILCAGSYRVLPTSDRVGTRLGGAALPRSAGYVDRSRPGVRGAIEVPPDGQPIVLGPEHPTTIGYAVIAVIASDHLDRFHLTRIGGDVRFVEVGHGAH